MIEKDNVLDGRIKRINHLLSRLDRIPEELREVESQLYKNGLSRDDFARLVDRRNALYIEHERVEREVKQEYKLQINEKS